MATKETIPFNFDDVYAYVSNKFVAAGYDVQVGSNAEQLTTAMSYLVSMLNANTAVNINETLLTLARKRKMALYDARTLGYEIEHKLSYRYNLTLEFSTPGTYVIKKYSKFISGTKTYYFMGGDPVLEPSVTVTTTPVQITIEVVEGTLTRFIDDSTLTKQIESVYNAEKGITEAQHYVDVPFTDVENDGLEVYLTYYDDAGILHEQEPWTRSDTFVIDKDTILNKQYVRLDVIDYGTPRIYFKLGDVGKELRVGTIIQTNVLQSSGTLGAITTLPTTTDLACTVVSYTLVLQGAEEESISSIKDNAPLFHNSANRMVTKPDYIAFSNRQAVVKYTDVWDGHDEFPTRPGHIWFSFVPTNTIRTFTENSTGTTWTLDNVATPTNWYLGSGDVTNVWTYMDDYKIPTLEYHHRNPIYFDFSYTINIVRYNSAISEAARNALVFDVVNNYFLGSSAETGVETFAFEYFESNLNKRIDIELTDLMGFNITSKMSISLSDNDVITEIAVDPLANPVVYYNEIRYHLGVPFETWITGGVIDTTKLPKIDTTDFIVAGNDIYVDYTTPTTENNGEITVYDIYYGSSGGGYSVVGAYKVYTGVVQTIEVILYVTSVGGYVTGLDPVDVANGITFDIVYPSPNVQFDRNTIPRLKYVEFV